MTNLSSAPLDLAPLYRHCLFRSREPMDSHERVAREFSDHNLDWKGGSVDTVMYRARASRLSVVMLRYGAEIEIRPKPFDDFALMHLTLQGVAEIEADGCRTVLHRGRSAVIAPRRNLRMRWQQGSEQLILKVPGSLLRECTGTPDAVSRLPATALLPTHAEPQWLALMQSLLHATALPGDEATRTAWVDAFERGVAGFMLAQHAPAGRDHDMTDRHDMIAARQTDAAHAGTDERRLEAMEDYMRARLAAPIALADLARVAGVSVRTLHTLSQKHRGVSPMDLLRALRLDAVRARLMREPGAAVTEAALSYGFGHLGRFSAYYRERFGELPSQTALRAA